ncbi:MAG: serine hydrolase domain-containing protein [Anaerolineae bacterium]
MTASLPVSELELASPVAVQLDPAALARAEAIVADGLGTVYPAAVLLVARGGRVAVHRAFGYLDPESKQQPTRVDSLFDLASVSKLFTATAFMTLVEAGRVSLDTSVAEILPAFAGVRRIGATEDPQTQETVPLDPAYAGHSVDASQVTFWHLLTHTSGLPAWCSLYREGGKENDVPLPHLVPADQRARRIAAIYDCDFAYPPGQRMVYSDLGLILLGEAIACLAGMPLDACLQQSVLDPLGLAHATYNPLARQVPREQIVPTEVCAWRGRRCHGEVHDENAASLGGVAGHAGLFATAWEVAVLAQTYLNGGRYGTARILSPRTVSEMTRMQVNLEDNPRGLGWLLRSASGSSAGCQFGPRSYGHTGYTGTSVWVDPDRELLVVLLTNRVYHGRDPSGIAALRPRLHDAVAEAIAEAVR